MGQLFNAGPTLVKSKVISSTSYMGSGPYRSSSSNTIGAHTATSASYFSRFLCVLLSPNNVYKQCHSTNSQYTTLRIRKIIESKHGQGRIFVDLQRGICFSHVRITRTTPQMGMEFLRSVYYHRASQNDPSSVILMGFAKNSLSLRVLAIS